MVIKKIVALLLISFSALGFSQELELSPLSKFSLLTVGTADELSSKFGHTAIRIQDPTISLNLVFGYGGFDFDDPNFYYKFTTGKLDYSMTAHRDSSFINGYKAQNRWIREQTINLTTEQKNKLFNFLKNNYRKENRKYKYDFLFDNCATKIPEVFKEIFGDELAFEYVHLDNESTFRQLLHEYLDTNSWSTFGIDLALGSVIDRKATAWEHQFLPLYVQKQFDHVTLGGKPIVTDEELILDVRPETRNNSFFLSPLFWLIGILILVIGLTYRNHKTNTRSRWLDFTLFLVNGIAGLLIAFLWFATDHLSTKTNFNILWAVAPNLIIAFLLLKKRPPQWIQKYLWILLAGIATTGVLWILKIQIFSPLLIFLLVALAVRYLFLIQTLKHSESSTIQYSNNQK